jgi:hypothetical protein
MHLKTMEHTYRSARINRVFMFAVLGAITAFSPLVAFSARQEPFLVVWLAILGFFWYVMLYRLAHEIRLGNGTATFRGLVRHSKVPVQRISRLQVRGNVLTVRWERGRVDLLFPIDGLHDFVKRVKAANPTVELVGI